MPTDTDRREVARRLRERAGKRVLNLGELLWCIGCDESDDAATWNRLADLIDPDTNFHYPPDSANSGPKDAAEVVLDRKEMLMIADELVDRARRIREALGVVA